MMRILNGCPFRPITKAQKALQLSTTHDAIYVMGKSECAESRKSGESRHIRSSAVMKIL